MPAATKERTSVLKAADRCDARDCTAQARVRAVLTNGSIDLCAHHFTPNEAAINDQATEVVDERDRIT